MSPDPRQFFRLANLIWWLGLPCIIFMFYDVYRAIILRSAWGESLWFVAHSCLAMSSMILLGLFLRHSPWRVASIKIGIALFFWGIYYFVAVFLYIFEIGLDSF